MSLAERDGATFRICALGHPFLEVIGEDGKRVIGPGKPLALVTYLALAARRTESRDLLCDLLWGDRTPELARRQLRQALWLVKTEIHPELLSAVGGSVSIATDLGIDVDEFLAAIESDDLAHALDLYRGDFFSDYAAPGAGRFEEWVSLERTRLRGRFTHAAETAARRSLDSGKFANAIAVANRMRSIEPHAQSAWRLLLEARVASSDSIGAIADADQFEQWLQHEEWEPEPASVSAIRAARNTGKSQGQVRAATDIVAELVGREKEFATLSAEWDTAQNGGARIVHVIGDSGLGKTRLVSDFVTRIRASRGRVKYVRANYGEREIPFSFAAAIAGELATLAGAKGVSQGTAETLTGLNPSLTSIFTITSSSETRITSLRTGLALVDLAGAVADEKPVTIILDDLHWADSESRDAISLLTARLASERLLIVTTCRPNYGASMTRDECHTLRLQPLRETDIKALVNSLSQLPDSEWSDEFVKILCESSGGSPLMVLESLRYCLDARLISRDSYSWHCDDREKLFKALRERASLGQRLQALSPSHLAVLRAIAVAGIPLPRPIVVKAAAIQGSETDRVISELELAGFLSSDHESVDLSHDSIAEEIVERSDIETLDRMHLRLGATMAAANDGQQWQSKSIQHLARAGAWTAAARQAARTLRDSNSRDAVDSGLRLLLGSASNKEAVTRIRRELPFSIRFPRWRQSVLLAIVPIVILASAFMLKSARPESPRDDTTLVVLKSLAPNKKQVTEFALDHDHWNPASALLDIGKRTATWSVTERPSHLTPRPGCSCWAVYSTYPDYGQGDIDLLAIDGSRTRLTKSRGDDLPSSFSPDGNRLLFLTTRWSRTGWSDIAMLNLQNGGIKRLTRDITKHSTPYWSPDGSRILFERNTDSKGSAEICVMDADGANLHCFSRPEWTMAGVIGWISDHQALINFSNAGGADLVVNKVDINSWELSPSDLPPRSEITVDPTAHWVIVRSAEQSNFIKLAPLGKFDQAMPLDSTIDTQSVFSIPRLPSSYVDSVSIEAPTGALVTGVPHILHAFAWTRDGRKVTPAISRWRSLTPSVATIDSLGVITAQTAGDAVIEISLGGWRTSVDTIRIRPQDAAIVLDEHWNGRITDRWLSFGEPKPVIERNGTSYMLNNNGDGNFFSGVYSIQTIDADRGAALDMIVSTPITRTQWQMIIAMMAGVGDPRQLAQWDRRTGYLASGSEFGCAFAYPTGEGAAATTRSAWYQSMKDAQGDSSYRLDDGRWYRVRIQILPDGRCGLAINGHAVAISAQSHVRTHEIVAALEGSNVGSRILVGRVTLYKGVPEDVDWRTLTSRDGYWWLHPLEARRSH